MDWKSEIKVFNGIPFYVISIFIPRGFALPLKLQKSGYNG